MLDRTRGLTEEAVGQEAVAVAAEDEQIEALRRERLADLLRRVAEAQHGPRVQPILAERLGNLLEIRLIALPLLFGGGRPVNLAANPLHNVNEHQLGAVGLGRARRRPSVCIPDFAGDFLVQYLQGGPRSTRDIWAAAQEQGLACKRTLQRARTGSSCSTIWRSIGRASSLGTVGAIRGARRTLGGC